MTMPTDSIPEAIYKFLDRIYRGDDHTIPFNDAILDPELYDCAMANDLLRSGGRVGLTQAAKAAVTAWRLRNGAVAGLPAPDAAPAAGGAGQTAPLPVHRANLAKAILLERPDIRPTELAKLCGVSPGTLYKKTGPWADIRQFLMARPDSPSAQGTKYSGDLEAWGEAPVDE
ncbi:MAG: hypothetical protein V2A79_17880 [Planctomycetota bacterium]